MKKDGNDLCRKTKKKKKKDPRVHVFTCLLLGIHTTPSTSHLYYRSLSILPSHATPRRILVRLCLVHRIGGGSRRNRADPAGVFVFRKRKRKKDRLCSTARANSSTRQSKAHAAHDRQQGRKEGREEEGKRRGRGRERHGFFQKQRREAARGEKGVGLSWNQLFWYIDTHVSWLDLGRNHHLLPG